MNTIAWQHGDDHDGNDVTGKLLSAMNVTRRTSMLAILAIFAITACVPGGTDAAATPDGPGAEPSPSPEPTAVPDGIETAVEPFELVSAGTSSFEELLAAIPDTPGASHSVQLSDIGTFRDMFGIAIPSPDADHEALMEYTWMLGGLLPDGEKIAPGPGLLLMQEAWLLGLHNYSTEFNTRPYFGFDRRDMNQVAVAGDGNQPVTVEVYMGEFDPDLTASLLAECDECVEADQPEYNGISYYAWGDNATGRLKDRFAPPAFDAIGRGGKMMVQDDRVLRTLSNGGMENAIDTISGNQSSLAEVEDHALAARGLAALDAFTALATRDRFDVDSVLDALCEGGDPSCPQGEDAVRHDLTGSPLLLPFSLVASGHGSTGDDWYVTLVLVHDDEATAEANVDRLLDRVREGTMPRGERDWVDIYERVEVGVDGRVLMAKLYPPPDTAWDLVVIQLPWARPLVVHE